MTLTLTLTLTQTIASRRATTPGGVPLAVVGVGKGAIGALARPAVGLLEGASKTAHAAALACLGKEGIVGTVQRRVRPPGVSSILLEEGLLEVRTRSARGSIGSPTSLIRGL